MTLSALLQLMSHSAVGSPISNCSFNISSAVCLWFWFCLWVPACSPVLLLAGRMECLRSHSGFMASMSSTEDARRMLWKLSRERLCVRLQLEVEASGLSLCACGEDRLRGNVEECVGAEGGGVDSLPRRVRLSSGHREEDAVADGVVAEGRTCSCSGSETSSPRARDSWLLPRLALAVAEMSALRPDSGSSLRHDFLLQCDCRRGRCRRIRRARSETEREIDQLEKQKFCIVMPRSCQWKKSKSLLMEEEKRSTCGAPGERDPMV